MEKFTFNNISSDSLNLIIKEMPLVSQSQRNIESISVNGRNGNLHIDNKNYNSKSYTLTCIVSNAGNIDAICRVLSGKGKLVLSKYNDRYFNATIMNQISFKAYGNYLQELPIQFELDPIAFSIQEKSLTINNSQNFEIGGNVEVAPIIKISGTGKVTINDIQLEIKESDIVIDCELMNCTKNDLSANEQVILNDFPKLYAGINTISFDSTITKVEFIYHEGWL